MSKEAKNTFDKMFDEVNLIQARFGKRSAEYYKAVRELGNILHQFLSHKTA